MRFVLVILCSFVLLSPFVMYAEEFNAGFVQGIWFGSEGVFANTPVRIYVALRNNTDHDLTGTVRFMDNEKRIGVSYVSALPGRLIEAWTDWTPAYGEHTIIATLSNTQLHPLGENPEMVEVVSVKSEMDIFVDYDTDTDGVSNNTDLDDDGDGVSDVDETSRGTDPLIYNKSEVSNGNTESTEHNADTEDESQETENSTETKTTEMRPGLEKYIENKTVSGALSKVTDVVGGAKSALDTYRGERNAERKTDIVLPIDEPIDDVLQSLPTTSEAIATITRSRIDKGSGFLHASLNAVLSFVGTLYSLMLWILSELLARPALIQLALLIFILLTLYGFARRFGRRPRTYD